MLNGWADTKTNRRLNGENNMPVPSVPSVGAVGVVGAVQATPLVTGKNGKMCTGTGTRTST